jgi:hypothetical protein
LPVQNLFLPRRMKWLIHCVFQSEDHSCTNLIENDSFNISNFIAR